MQYAGKTKRPDIYIVENIGSGFLAVMAKPVAGEYITERFADLAGAGVRQVMSLLEASESVELGLRDEAHHVHRAGMRFLEFPTADRGVPASVPRSRR